MLKGHYHRFYQRYTNIGQSTSDKCSKMCVLLTATVQHDGTTCTIQRVFRYFQMREKSSLHRSPRSTCSCLVIWSTFLPQNHLINEGRFTKIKLKIFSSSRVSAACGRVKLLISTKFSTCTSDIHKRHKQVFKQRSQTINYPIISQWSVWITSPAVS